MQQQPVEHITRMPLVGDIVTYTTGGCYTNNLIIHYGYLADIQESVAVVIFDDWEHQELTYPPFFQTTEINVGDLGLPKGQALWDLAEKMEGQKLIGDEHKPKFEQWLQQ